jgi:CRP/FNR family cyclic AMP-dependent transcriptional regulator
LATDFSNVRGGDYEDFGPGEILYTQGESPDGMFVVLEGEVALRVNGELVETVGPGGVLGEMALVEGASRTTLAESVSDARVLRVDRRLFETMVIQDPEFARLVLRTMSARLRKMNIAAGGTGGEGGDPKPSDTTSRVILAMKGQTAYPAGATIFKEGDRGDKMYFVQSGSVELRVGGKPVMTVEAGTFFGEMALIEEAPRSASAHAGSDCKLMPVDRGRFEYLIRMTPDFVLEMMRTIAARARAMSRK